MDDIIATLDRALAERGLSDSAASRLAVGNPSLIKNLRANRQNKRYSYAALKSLADVLGLELYFGTPRGAAAPAIAEVIRLSGNPQHDATDTNGQPAGFLPFAFHAQSFRTGLGPIAFSQVWLSDQGLAADRLSLVEAASNGDTNGAQILFLALVDQAALQDGGPALWCYRINGQDRIARLLWLDMGLLMILPEESTLAPEVLQGSDRKDCVILGRVVWVGQTHNGVAPGVL